MIDTERLEFLQSLQVPAGGSDKTEPVDSRVGHEPDMIIVGPTVGVVVKAGPPGDDVVSADGTWPDEP